MTDAKKEKGVNCLILFFSVDGARLKVMLMKRIITFILNSNKKILVNLLGYLYRSQIIKYKSTY